MKLNLPRCIPSALAVFVFAFSTRADTGDAREQPPPFEEHAIDPKVAETIKNSKSPEDAVHSLTQLVIQDPDNADLWYQVGDACYAAHDTQKAISAYKKCLALDPKRKGVWSVLGLLYYSAGEYSQSLPAFQNALKIDPADIGALNNMAVVLMEGGQLDDAQQAAGQARELQPDDPAPMLTLGDILLCQGKFQESEDILLKLVAAKPDDPAAWKALMACYKNEGKDGDAARCRRKLAELGVADHAPEAAASTSATPAPSASPAPPDRKSAVIPEQQAEDLFNKAKLLYNKKNYPEAEAALRKALEISPQNPAVLTMLGLCLLNQKKTGDAVTMFQTALDLKTDFAGALQGMAMCQSQLQHYPEAEQAAAKYVAINPKATEIWTILIDSCVSQQKWEEADQQARRAMRYFPGWPDPWLADGYALKGMKQYDAAVAAFQKVTEMQPLNPWGWIGLGRTYGEMGQLEKCFAPFQRATEVDPSNADTWNCLGYANFTQGKLKEAIALYQKSIDCNATFETAWSNLARAYSSENDAADTAGTCDKIARFNPDLARQLRVELNVK